MGGLIAYRPHAHQFARRFAYPFKPQDGRVRLALLGVLLAIVTLGTLGGCSTLGFYQQAVVGQLRLLNAREDVEDLLETADLTPDLRAALLDSQAVLRFAETELGLEADGRYHDYVALDRPYVVWNLVVAPVDSVVPRTWCFPVAGCVSYRGYFKRARAEANAAKFDTEEFDTYIGGVPAYSTLGWFNDPLLSSFIHWPQPARAELLMHELAHGRLYVAGDTPFNESFATFVAEHGLPRYLAQQDASPKDSSPQEGAATLEPLERHRVLKAERARFNALLLKLRERIGRELQALPVELEGADRRAQARKIRETNYAAATACYVRVQDQFTDKRGLQFLQAPPNLARLSLVGAYFGWVDAFGALFAEHNQDLTLFYEAAEALTELSYDERQLELKRLAAKAGSEANLKQQIQSHGNNQYPKEIECEALTNHLTDGDVAG